MEDLTPVSYQDFLICDWAKTMLVEFYLKDQLICVSVIDLLTQGISAVYSFFAPEYEHRGLGTHAILWQIKYAMEKNLRYLYLGYWIQKCSKMNYKTNFQPIEGYVNGKWRLLNK